MENFSFSTHTTYRGCHSPADRAPFSPSHLLQITHVNHPLTQFFTNFSFSTHTTYIPCHNLYLLPSIPSIIEPRSLHLNTNNTCQSSSYSVLHKLFHSHYLYSMSQPISPSLHPQHHRAPFSPSHLLQITHVNHPLTQFFTNFSFSTHTTYIPCHNLYLLPSNQHHRAPFSPSHLLQITHVNHPLTQFFTNFSFSTHTTYIPCHSL